MSFVNDPYLPTYHVFYKILAIPTIPLAPPPTSTFTPQIPSVQIGRWDVIIHISFNIHISLIYQ